MEYDRQIAEEVVDDAFGDVELVHIKFVRAPLDKKEHSAWEVRRGGTVVEVAFPDGSGTFEAAWEDYAAAQASSFYYGMLAASS